jgi:hypothetical protein
MERKRISVAISSDNYAKLEDLSERYGITSNSVMAFIIGDWLDKNYNQQILMSEMVNKVLSSPEDVFNNPNLLEMVKEILKDDKEFKNALKAQMEN